MDRLRQVALVLFLGVLAVAAYLSWLWRRIMPKKPAEVTQEIKAKVASVKATRAKKKPEPAGLAAIQAASGGEVFEIDPSYPHYDERPGTEYAWDPANPPTLSSILAQVAPEAATHCPQGAPWCCHVCGNMATGPVCTVDGAKGNA